MSKAIRDVYGEVLSTLEDPQIVVIDADVSASTKSCLFAKKYPNRFYNVGIAEANMAGMAAGFASVGKIPFINTFAVFMTSNGMTSIRAFASYSKLPIKMMGAYGGVSDAFDGPSHHALEDIAVMRALPNVQVYVPCDPVETEWLIRRIAETKEPVYVRLSRGAFPDVYAQGEQFELGKGKVVREGSDCTVIACGLLVGNALKAADILEAEGMSVRVVDMFSIKPLDEELIVKCAQETGAIVSGEEHTIYGGLGSAVAEVLVKNNCRVPMQFVGVNDTHAECGSYSQLQQKYGISVDAVCDAVRKTVKNK